MCQPRLGTGAFPHTRTSPRLRKGERPESVLRGLVGKWDWASPCSEEKVEEKKRPQGPACPFLACKVVGWERDRLSVDPNGQNKETGRRFAERLI